MIGLPLFLSQALNFKYFIESPRFLVANCKFKQARSIFRYISVFNNRPAFEFHLFQEIS